MTDYSSAVIDLTSIELKSKRFRIVAILSTICVQNSYSLAVGCGLNDFASYSSKINKHQYTDNL
jgi:hypothetical protein